MTQAKLQAIENGIQGNMQMHDNILICPHPVLITDILTGSYRFIVQDYYVPEDETDYDDIIYYLSPNTTIDYKSSQNTADLSFHLELNPVKNKRPVKKFSIHIQNRSDLDEIYDLHYYPNRTVPPCVPSRGMYDRLNSVSISPGIKNEEDDLFTNKEKYRNRIRKLQMSIRPIGNKKSSNSPDYDQIQKTNLYRSLIPYYANEDAINERVDVGPDYDFNWFNNHNHNYSDFIHEFDQIHLPNINDFFASSTRL
jgi:hypothetical protein